MAKAIEPDPDFAPSLFRLGRLLLAKAYTEGFPSSLEPRESKQARMERLATEGAGYIEQALQRGRGPDDALERSVAEAMLAYARRDAAAARRIALEGVGRFEARRGVEELHWVLGLTSSSHGKDITACARA